MKIFKGQFGWSTSAFSKNPEDKTENKLYVNVQFKKGTEPILDTLEGDLIFREKSGNERPCFLSSYKKKDNSVAPKLIIMGNETHKSEMMGGNTPTINEEQIGLPFYGG